MKTFLIKYLNIFQLIWKIPINIIRNNSINFSNKIESNVRMNNCRLGNYNYIGPNSILNNVIIGNYCSFAPNVQVGGMEHSYWWGSTSSILSEYNISNNKTIIEDDVWLAANVVIKQGVRIGRGSVVGASSVVLNDVPPYAIVVGIPGKIIKYRFNQKTIKELSLTEYWKLNPKQAKNILKQFNYNSE